MITIGNLFYSLIVQGKMVNDKLYNYFDDEYIWYWYPPVQTMTENSYISVLYGTFILRSICIYIAWLAKFFDIECDTILPLRRYDSCC